MTLPVLNIVVGASLLIAGALVIAICIPLLRGDIGPNAFYGVRLAKAFESREIWFKMNRYGARQLILYACGVMALGALAFFLPLENHAGLAISLGFGPAILVLIPVLQICRYAKTL